MRLPRDLSGAELVEALCRHWGYRQVHRVGSHLVLETDEPFHQRIAVPDHGSLRVGTLNAILRAVARHKGIEKDELLASLRG
jgi:predicted RNA binding protein YcfA (HicA-like mRNA interferase family)